jgi:hypothetical protein
MVECLTRLGLSKPLEAALMDKLIGLGVCVALSGFASLIASSGAGAQIGGGLQ